MTEWLGRYVKNVAPGEAAEVEPTGGNR